MKSVGVYEAKTNLPRLLQEVRAGERITITRHGVPIAQIIPAEPPEPEMTPKEAIAALREFRKGKRLDGITIRELIEEGRKY